MLIQSAAIRITSGNKRLLPRHHVVPPVADQLEHGTSGLCPSCKKNFASRESMVHHYKRYHDQIEVTSANVDTGEQLQKILAEIKKETGRNLIRCNQGEDSDPCYACDLIREDGDNRVHVDGIPIVPNCTAFLSTRTKRNRTMDVRYCMHHSHTMEKDEGLVNPPAVQILNMAIKTETDEIPSISSQNAIRVSLINDRRDGRRGNKAQLGPPLPVPLEDETKDPYHLFVAHKDSTMGVQIKEEPIDSIDAEFLMNTNDDPLTKRIKIEEIDDDTVKRVKVEEGEIDYKMEYEKLKEQMRTHANELSLIINYKMDKNAKEIITSVRDQMLKTSQD